MRKPTPQRDAEVPDPSHRVIIDPDANRLVEKHCGRDPTREVCGVLVGFVFVDERGPCTRVVGSIEGRHAREEQMSVTFTHETWDAVHEALASRDDRAKVVGWYHSHPDFGIFFSAPDVFVQRNFFGSEGQIGLVIDPVRGERGVFLQLQGEIRTLPKYEVARQNRGGHMVPCKYIDEPLRESRDEARAAAETGTSGMQQSLDSIEAVLARVERSSRSNERMTMLWLPIVALFSMLLGFLYGRWTAPRLEDYVRMISGGGRNGTGVLVPSPNPAPVQPEPQQVPIKETSRD